MTISNFNFCSDFSRKYSKLLEGDFEEISKQDLEKAYGRKNKNCNATKPGSVLYIAYENETVLYVGETSTTVKRRFISDGSGAHNKKVWYKKMTLVRFCWYKHDVLLTKERKLLEQALAIFYKPQYYGKLPVDG